VSRETFDGLGRERLVIRSARSICARIDRRAMRSLEAPTNRASSQASSLRANGALSARSQLLSTEPIDRGAMYSIARAARDRSGSAVRARRAVASSCDALDRSPTAAIARDQRCTRVARSRRLRRHEPENEAGCDPRHSRPVNR
jgi:hypothetical protein